MPDYQIRAKDILTCAAELFETENLRDKAAEARVGLANCYWFSGEINEYDDILRSIESEFGADPRHPVSLQIRLNRIFAAIWQGDRKETERLIKEVSIPIASCYDLRLLTQFHNLAGIFYHDIGDFAQNALHLNEALRVARKANNKMFVAFNLNNLAMTNRGIGNFEQAHELIEEAISIMESREDRGWIAHAFDTKALIYLN